MGAVMPRGAAKRKRSPVPVPALAGSGLRRRPRKGLRLPGRDHRTPRSRSDHPLSVLDSLRSLAMLAGSRRRMLQQDPDGRRPIKFELGQVLITPAAALTL